MTCQNDSCKRGLFAAISRDLLCLKIESVILKVKLKDDSPLHIIVSPRDIVTVKPPYHLVKAAVFNPPVYQPVYVVP